MTIGSNQTIEDKAYVETTRDAVQDAANQTKFSLNSQNPDLSSCLDSVQLLSLEKIDDGLTLYVSITTSNGVTAAIAVPFPEFGLDT